MLASLSIFDWLRLAAACLLFVGPGAAVMSFHPARSSVSMTGRITFSILFALATWPVILAWLQLLGIHVPTPLVFVFFAAAWLLAVWRSHPSRLRLPRSLRVEEALLWFVVLAVSAAGVYALRALAVGPGSDAYHHTLIAQLIVDNRGLPSNYLPYARLVTFTYHFGFHAFAAAVTQLCGLPARVVVPVLAQLLVGLAALGTAYFTGTFTRSRLAAVVAGVVVAFVAVFPAYLINYGRYTQLAGTVLLTGLLAAFYEWRARDWSGAHVPFIALLAGGIALTHYRVTLMAATAILVIFGVALLLERPAPARFGRVVARWLAAAAAALLLVAPWVIHVLVQRSLGYSLVTDSLGSTFFSLGRLGPTALGYPTNGLLIALLVAAVFLALAFRDRDALLVLAWGVVMLVASTPLFAGLFVDTVSVIISLFVPAAYLIGAMTARVVALITARAPLIGRAAIAAVLLSVLVFSLISLPRQSAIAEPGSAFVQPEDLAAIHWIEANTPPTALFMTNTYHWDFSRKFIIGIDAGFWLPLLAHRQTVTMPMTFSIERGSEPKLLTDLVALDGLEGQLASPRAIAALRAAGVTHVFVGAQGGKIAAQALAHSPEMELLYSNGQARVFALRGVEVEPLSIAGAQPASGKAEQSR